MICKNCEIPMLTENGSEKGESSELLYGTREIKICPRCGMRVMESYCAEVLTPGELPEIKVKN